MNRKPDKNRFLSALKGGKTGEIPNFEITINARGVSHFLGKETDKGWWQLSPEESIKLAREIGQDIIPCADLKWGIPGKTVLTPEDAHKSVPPGKNELRERFLPFTEAVRGTDIGLLLALSEPFTGSTMAAAPNATESFMYMLYDSPETVTAMMDVLTEYNLSVIEATADMEFDIYYIGDDIGGLIGPDFIEKEWALRMGKLITRAQETGRPVMCHCCGDQTDVLPWFDKWGVDAVHPLQPKYNDIYEVREQYPELTLVGNIDIDILTRGSKDELTEDVKQHLDRLAPSGRYVACSSHSIIDSVPPENFETMLNIIQSYNI